MSLVVPPSYQTPFCFIAIDPGTNFLGLSVFTIDPQTLLILKIEPMTIDVEGLYDPVEYHSAYYTARFQKYLKIQHDFSLKLQYYNPVAIICEAPFYNRFRPAAFAPLAELLQGLRIQTHQYNPWIYFYVIDPSTVKKSVGAGHISGKEEVKAAILKHGELAQASTVAIEKLDEHAIDSLAVGLTYLGWLRSF